MNNSISQSTLSDKLKNKFEEIKQYDIDSDEFRHFCNDIFQEKPDTYTVIFKKRLPDVYEHIADCVGFSNSEKFYNYINKNENLIKCKINDCGNLRSWRKKYTKGYSDFCSIKCANKDINLKEKRLDTYIKTGGLQRKQKNDKINCLLKHGKEFYFQVDSIKEKIQNSMISSYGVSNVMQVPKFTEKVLNSFKTKTFIFENKEVIYKGYENIGLEYIKSNTNLIYDVDYFFGILNMPKILYMFDNKQKRYYADIYIKSLNLIVEIKSEWTYKYELEKNIAKQNSCISNGYNHEFWICDKTQLIRFINQYGENKSKLI